jgi:hypothetical protein
LLRITRERSHREGGKLVRDFAVFDAVLGALDFAERGLEHQRLTRSPRVWILPRQQVVERSAKQENIRPRPHILGGAFGLLRRHECGGACGVGRATQRGRNAARRAGHGCLQQVGIPQHGEPPIHQHNFAERTNHDLSWLDVSMDDPARMRECDRLCHVDQDGEVFGQEVRHRERLEIFRENQIPRFTSHEFHRQQRAPVLVESQVVHGGNVRMVQRGGGHRFLAERNLVRTERAFGVGFVLIEIGTDAFDCDATTQRGLGRFPDFTESSPRDHAHQGERRWFRHPVVAARERVRRGIGGGKREMPDRRHIPFRHGWLGTSHRPPRVRVLFRGGRR